MSEPTLEGLQAQIDGLQKVVTGQAAMIALLSTMLAQREVLTVEDAMLVATAGVEAQEHDTTPGNVTEWAIKNLREIRDARAVKDALSELFRKKG